MSPEAGQVSVRVGDGYVLNCSATGIPTPVVLWTKDGEEIPQTVRGFVVDNSLVAERCRCSSEFPRT